jgi:hypothetical protein
MSRIAAALVVFGLLAAPAFAGKPDHAGKGGGKGKGKGGGSAHDYDHDRDGGNDVTIVFSSGQRSSYHDWYANEYGRGHCPPGLAKKNNGCLPPGQAKKRYAIGQPLPPGIVIGVVPPSLAVILGPPPSGYRYGIVDGDVVKLAIGTLLVVDALDGLLN